MYFAQILGERPTALRIGSLSLSGRVLLAPMAGVTDAGLRRAAHRRGAALTFSEMVASTGLLEGEAECVARAAPAEGGPRATQLVGCEPAAMAEAARRLEAEGAELIDINMGCPARRVAGALAGSALMRDLDAAGRILESVVSAVKVPVSVKTRLGWDDANRNAVALAAKAQAVGVKMVTVHGRTRCQFYQGAADWRAVAEVVAAVEIPVVVNGDCRSLEDARAMLATSGASAVMIGRAAIGAPWIIGAFAKALERGAPVAAPAPNDRRDDAIGHLEYLLTSMGARAGLRHARKHLSAYVANEGAPESLRRALVTTEAPAEAFDLLARAFEPALERAA
jgi:tRNA-dihydrouridine synthase B